MCICNVILFKKKALGLKNVQDKEAYYDFLIFNHALDIF